MIKVAVIVMVGDWMIVSGNANADEDNGRTHTKGRKGWKMHRE